MLLLDNKNYQVFKKDINNKDIFVDYILSKNAIHPSDNIPLIIFIKCIHNKQTYVLNLGHQDDRILNIDYNEFLKITVQLSNRVFVCDKKKFINLFPVKNVNDILIYKFQIGHDGISDLDFTNTFESNLKYKVGSDYIDLNKVIPIVKHLESFEDKFNFLYKDIINFKCDYSFQKLNGIITETLSEIENNGIYVDKDLFTEYFRDKNVNIHNSMVYSEYNIFTSTGRPSNRFGKINYAALNKEDDCRKCFISRFNDDGFLFSIDYSAYHPHIISNLINYEFDISENIYKYLGKQYFNKEILDDVDIKKSKNITFQNLYGGIRDEYKRIKYFEKVCEYINHRWNFFLNNGYVETPVFKRKITDKHISDPNPNKLFNYILQAAETEFSIQNIDRVNNYLRNKESKVILYTFDSILVDFCKKDGNQCLVNIKNIMVDNKFPVKCHVGKNYKELYEFDIK